MKKKYSFFLHFKLKANPIRFYYVTLTTFIIIIMNTTTKEERITYHKMIYLHDPALKD